MPMKDRPVLTHATPVVPLPIQLSSTVSPGLVYVLMRYSISAQAFVLGDTVPRNPARNGYEFTGTRPVVHRSKAGEHLAFRHGSAV